VIDVVFIIKVACGVKKRNSMHEAWFELCMNLLKKTARFNFPEKSGQAVAASQCSLIFTPTTLLKVYNLW
jgi:hypothetical protein